MARQPKLTGLVVAICLALVGCTSSSHKTATPPATTVPATTATTPPSTTPQTIGGFQVTVGPGVLPDIAKQYPPDGYHGMPVAWQTLLASPPESQWGVTAIVQFGFAAKSSAGTPAGKDHVWFAVEGELVPADGDEFLTGTIGASCLPVGVRAHPPIAPGKVSEMKEAAVQLAGQSFHLSPVSTGSARNTTVYEAQIPTPKDGQTLSVTASGSTSFPGSPDLTLSVADVNIQLLPHTSTGCQPPG